MAKEDVEAANHCSEKHGEQRMAESPQLLDRIFAVRGARRANPRIAGLARIDRDRHTSIRAADAVDPLRRHVRSDPHEMLSAARYRFNEIELRLQRLEKYVTSNRFQLDREFRRLKN